MLYSCSLVEKVHVFFNYEYFLITYINLYSFSGYHCSWRISARRSVLSKTIEYWYWPWFRGTKCEIFACHSSFIYGLSLQQIQPAPFEDHVKRVYLMSIMWSLGALFELPEREKLEVYMRASYKFLDFPPIKVDVQDSMFDYYVDSHGKKCRLWSGIEG